MRGHLARNSLLNLAGAMAPMIVGLLLLPVITRGLGVARFGILGLALAILEYSNLFGLGLGPATTKYVADSVALGRGDARALAWTSALGQTLLGLAGGAVIALLAPTLAGSVFEIPPGLVSEATAVFRLVGLLIPATLLLASLLGALEGVGRFDASNAIRVPVSAASFVVPAVGVVFGAGLSAIVGWLVAIRVVAALAAARQVRRTLPETSSLGSWRDLKRLLSLGAWISVSNVLNPILVYADRFLLGSLRGVASAGLYAAPFDALLRVLVVPGSLIRALMPSVSASHTLGDSGRMRRVFNRSVAVLVLALAPPLLVVAVFAPSLLGWWLGPEFGEGAGTAARILAGGVFVNALANVPTAMLVAMGRADVSAKFHLVEVVLYLPAAFWLISRYGVTGAAVAWSARVTVDALLLYAVSRRMLDPRVNRGQPVQNRV